MATFKKLMFQAIGVSALGGQTFNHDREMLLDFQQMDEF
jgi:hypothetical protein